MKINEYYDGVASEYENIINSPKINAKLMNKLREIFVKYNIIQGHILDVGCGPGNLKTNLGSNFSYVGVDISKNMLKEAEKKGYKMIEGKIEEVVLSFPNKSFDYVIALSSLQFVKDIKSLVLEFERVARKGWIISLMNVTESYIENFPVNESLYNHTKVDFSSVQEDTVFTAWISLKGEEMKERMVFKMLS